MYTYGIDAKHHIIAANEGNSTAIAAGYYLSTGKYPVVYMQNSGQGNIINPVASLLNPRVYAIPTIFIIGWRGEPGVHDEPQHIYQGEVTLKLLEDMEISSYVIEKTTAEDELEEQMKLFRHDLKEGKSVAFVVRKGAITYDNKVEYKNKNQMLREEVIEHIVTVADKDIIISTTGKASRELFEIRENRGQEHKYDFLTVGSMGHSSSIALGIALNKENSKVWCIDGDGACLMHMGAMPVIASLQPKNLVHIVVNNEAHETVGGMPAATASIDLQKIALACGYKYAVSTNSLDELDKALRVVKESNELSFIEVKTAMGARSNLGRPTISAVENKQNFMSYLNEI